MAKKGSAKKGSKSKSQRRVLDAFQLAEKAESRNRHNNDSDYSSDDDNDTKNGILNAKKLMGQTGDDDEDESEFEDEELDSDEALGSDDELDILNSKFSQTIRDKAKAKKKGELESDEEDEGGYTSIDEDDLMPLSAVWDLDDKEQANKDSNDKTSGEDIVLDDDISSSSEEDDESSEDELSESDEEDVFKGFDDDNDEEVELKSVQKSLTKDEKNRRSKKKLNNFQLEENEFNLPTNGQKLSLADMMSGVDASATKETFLLNPDEEKEESQTLAVPLAKRIQERHERKAAYEIQIEEVNKWEDTVKENRRAEVLKFPLNVQTENVQASSFDPTSKPMTELETKVNDMLEQSALVDTKKESQFEEIAIAKLSKEDLQKRQAELRLMRELMFREEKKAKRIKKIKSKTFHKIKNKEARRNQELVEGDESDAEDHDVKRAKERMTLKHKNQSKWAKTMIKSGMSKDAENRGEMEEMLRQGERLRSKIMGHNEDGYDSDEKNLSDLEKDEVLSDEENVKTKLGKGVMAMDFMKNADKRAKLENEQNLKQLREFENDEDRLKDFERQQNSINIEKNEGRRVYAPSVNRQKQDMDELNQETLEQVEIDESRSLVNRLNKQKGVAQDPKEDKKNTTEISEPKEPKEEVNPWLQVGSTKSGSRSSKISGVVDQNSSKLAKAAHQINKKKRTKTDVAAEDAIIDMDQTLNIVDPYGGSDNEQEDQGQEQHIHMFKQKDLIKEAFAGDDVVNEFEEEKKQVAIDEGDKEVDLTLPGWGDWAGVKKSKRKKIVKKINGVVETDKRKDKNIKSVIINERVNKKNIKYQSNGVPYPFETMEQYERSLRMPIGQEWTSRETHQRLTMPRVIAKHGTVIDPLKAPFK